MELYGYTVVDTLGYDDGTESNTLMFLNRDERNQRAYERFVNELKYAIEEEQLDTCFFEENEKPKIPTFEEFMEKFDGKYVFFCRHDTHFQIECWDGEV